jgi:lipoprotein-anchoring transpeptidase ErfK/SrfK
MTLRATGSTPDVRGYGIHGTWDESTIGKSESAGCIRMKNRDVEELYVLLPPGTPVTIGE